MIIIFGGIKGGTGKTTLAINSAIGRVMQGKKVLFLDAGLSEMGLYFSKKRKNLEIPTNLEFAALDKTMTVEKLKSLSKNYDDMIIDLRIDEAYNILYLAEVLILPFQCSFFDINSLNSLMPKIDSVKLINEKLKVYGLLTCVRPKDKDEKKFQDTISRFMTCLPSMYNRKAYDRAIFNGLSVFEEKRKDFKCCNELNTMLQTVTSSENIFRKPINWFNKNSGDIKNYYLYLACLILIYVNIKIEFNFFNFKFFPLYFVFMKAEKSEKRKEF